MPVDQDSVKHLEATRKGKPRHFVMVCKGVKVLNLVVFQKGSLAGKIKEAKEQGTGKIFAGTVVGSGQDIRFQLLQSEYDAPPGRELILKDYLASEAEFKCLPTYELVGELTTVPEVDPDDQVPTKGQPSAPAAPTSTTTAATTTASAAPKTSAEADRLAAAMTKLTPAIQQAVANYPTRREEILKPVAAFRTHLKDNKLGEAGAALVQVGQLLKSLSESATEAPTARESANAPAAPTASSDDPQAAVYAECRELYSKARRKVKTNLQRLEEAMLGVCTLDDGFDPGDAADRAPSIYQVLDVLDERLLQILDRAVANPDQRERLNEEALDVVDEYLSYATSDPFVTALENNGFVAVGVRRNMVDALGELARKL